jgi:transaldolase
MGDRPVSVEVTTNDHKEMIRQARQFTSWAGNLVVKIPVVNEYGESCLGVVHTLTQEGIRINTTAILSFNQAMLAAKAGATYVSIFGGRIADEGNDPAVVIRNVRQWLDEWKGSAEIIVGSIRTAMDIQSAALAGAHVVTIPPQFLPKIVDHKYTRETVRQFNNDAERALAQIAHVLAGGNREAGKV